MVLVRGKRFIGWGRLGGTAATVIGLAVLLVACGDDDDDFDPTPMSTLAVATIPPPTRTASIGTTPPTSLQPTVQLGPTAVGSGPARLPTVTPD
jgi:hypothetical protein